MHVPANAFTNPIRQLEGTVIPGLEVLLRWMDALDVNPDIRALLNRALQEVKDAMVSVQIAELQTDLLRSRLFTLLTCDSDYAGRAPAATGERFFEPPDDSEESLDMIALLEAIELEHPRSARVNSVQPSQAHLPCLTKETDVAPGDGTDEMALHLNLPCSACPRVLRMCMSCSTGAT